MIELSTDQLHWNKKTQTFSQEISSLDLELRPGSHVLIRNPKTRIAVTFKYLSTDTSGEDTAGWWFQSVGFRKEIKLLLIND